MNSHQIRKTFTDFFVNSGHILRPSASLIPADPTLLVVNAGMVPFKPYFLGQEEPPFSRATSIQKCVRTVDIDIIGTTSRHLSFFEMMGNFSCGEYFKSEAIAFSYDFVTESLGLDLDRLWFTVHETDDEAEQIWIDEVGVPPDRVQRGGNDNFWQMGVPGPCGPSSEIFWDRGPAHGEPGGPFVGTEDRYVEIWNLVFMQNIQDEPYHVVGELPDKSIDTGMGLERIAAVLQDVPSVFEIDTIRPLVAVAEAYTGLGLGDSEETDVILRILADHARSVAFLIGDGLVPSNEGRGYVLRRLLRRMVRHGWTFHEERLLMPSMASTVIDLMAEAYPGLGDARDRIVETVTREEEKFRRTLASGHRLLDDELDELEPGGELSGAVAFKLHDTFGFPIELTGEIAAERGYGVDRSGFEMEMAAQRDRARLSWKGAAGAAASEVYRSVLDEVGLTEFIGYTEEAGSGRVLSIVADGEPIQSAEEERDVEIFLDRTPFYAESGGQVGDVGTLTSPTGEARVVDTQYAVPGLHGHRVRVVSGVLSVGQEVATSIDSPRREAIRKSHTGTHVLHWALRDVLGEHATQAGSLVEPGRLRFDFSHTSAVAGPEIEHIERLVNEKLIANHEVRTRVTTREDALEMGALAFFGDKYGETVRVVTVGAFSIEFCGGTHTRAAGEVGPLVVMGESSIGSNLRRVEALTGMAAYRRLAETRRSLDALGSRLRVPALEVPQRVEALLEKVEGLEGELGELRRSQLGAMAAEIAAEAGSSGGWGLVVERVSGLDPNDLRQLALGVRDRMTVPALVVLGSDGEGRGLLVGAASQDLVDKGLSAGELIAEGARLMGGGGSRDPVLAQAGGPDGEKLEEALTTIRSTAEKALSGL